ncbi:MAG: lysine--tRNA ligase [Planctomycetales bacterium]|nr:lysine--tRNA ligase [Planctomycetales bacterium]
MPDRLEAARLEKLHALEALGVDPWGERFDNHLPIGRAREQCPTEAGVIGAEVRVAGRIMLRNNKGKLKFFHIKDWTGRIQLMCSKSDFSEEQWKLVELLDLGDLIGVDGHLKVSNTGEKTIGAKQITFLTKSLAQPPEKFHGAKDVEMLLRQRYIDLIYNEGVLDRMLQREKIIASIRQTLRDRSFVEAETPVLHAIAGGAAARPFTTHHNALDMQLYLRIALELHLKRLMVGGVERVYEIGRVFRNEGVDATHNPEFTMIELYQAYGNYETMMELTEALFVNAIRASRLPSPSGRGAGGEGASHVAGPELQTETHSTPPHPNPLPEGEGTSLVLAWGDKQVDYTPPWPRLKYADLFREHAGCDMHDPAALLEAAKRFHVETTGKHHDVLINDVFEEAVEPHLAGPVFVIDYPSSICPLTKRKKGQPEIAERFELFIDGMELANAYTELNDPRLQEDLFRTQLAGMKEEDSMAKMDHDFVRALKTGMPPAGGLGIGIDRMVMLLTNSHSIRDVIYFPLLRHEKPAGSPADVEDSAE